jgi:AraC-like DNA-binding protein
MKPIPLIRASVAILFAELLGDAGVPVDHLWSQAGLSARTRFEPEALIPLRLAIDFMEESAARAGMPDLGIRVARKAGLATVGRFGVAIGRAPTLYRALETACELVAMHNSGARYWLVPEGAAVRFCRRFRDRQGDYRQGDLLTVALMIELVRVVAGPTWHPAQVELQSAAPLELDDADLLGDATVDVGRPATSITIPRALLSRPLLQTALLLPPPRTASPPPGRAQPTDFVTSLEVIVATLLESGSADLATAARAAGSSVRSLQRRLTELGATYSELVDRVRFRIACSMLEDGGVKVVEIAFALGYSDPAHFTRAFRRWTSLTPLEYRQLQLTGQLARHHSA